jgi:nicotinamidase-related amidase
MYAMNFGEAVVGVVQRDGSTGDDGDRRIALRESYAVRGIGHRIEPGARPAVLVVDFISGFTDPSYVCGSNCDAAVEATASLLATAREAGVPIIFSTIVFDSARATSSVWLAKMPAMKCLEPGTEAVLVDPRLAMRDNEILVTKTATSCFTGTDLTTILVQLGVDTLVITGTTTSGCVRASVVDACMGGLRVFVPRECVADRASDPHEASLFDIQAKYGEVVDLNVAVSIIAARVK